MSSTRPVSRLEFARRWGLTQRSAEGGVSFLAISETLLALSFSLWLVIWWESWWHILASAVVAPIVMLGSEESRKEAAKRFTEWQLDPIVGQNFDFPLWSLYPRLFASALYVRVSSTLKHLRLGVRQFPRNYTEALIVSDTSGGVRLVPGTPTLPSIIKTYTPFGNLGLSTISMCIAFAIILSLFGFGIHYIFGDSAPLVVSNIGLLGFIPAFMLAYIVGVLFSYIAIFVNFWIKVSVKLSCFVWIPIIYLAIIAPAGVENTIRAIEDERRSALQTVLRVFAWFVLIFTLWRVLIFPSTYEWWLQQDWSDILLVAILPIGTEPSHLNLWHIASGVSAAMTLSFYYFLWDRNARRIERKEVIPTTTLYLYKVFYWIRGLISIYTISCSFYFIAIGANLISISGINWCIFPWSKGCE